MIALDRKHDPFYAGTPAQRRDAEWFAEKWERFRGVGGHLRRIHYRILGHGIIRPDMNTLYVNDKRSWGLR